MSKYVSKKQRFLDQLTLTSDDEVYVGIDVHSKKCHLAIWLNEAVVLTYVTPSG